MHGLRIFLLDRGLGIGDESWSGNLRAWICLDFSLGFFKIFFFFFFFFSFFFPFFSLFFFLFLFFLFSFPFLLQFCSHTIPLLFTIPEFARWGLHARCWLGCSGQHSAACGSREFGGAGLSFGATYLRYCWLFWGWGYVAVLGNGWDSFTLSVQCAGEVFGLCGAVACEITVSTPPPPGWSP